MSKRFKKRQEEKTPDAKKSLGQNFLKDEEALEVIIQTAQLKEEDSVLEIGPGTGLLTDRLIEKSKEVFAIEKDYRMIAFLEEKYSINKEVGGESKISILEGDILEINLAKTLNRKKFTKYKLVANIPYYITGKIIRLFLETKNKPEVLVLLVQKEVAQRICAEVGSMSILAASVQYFGKPELIRIVPKESFEPSPKVDSAIIKITPFIEAESESEVLRDQFFRALKSGFSSPRKKVLSNLHVSLKIEKEILRDIFSKFGWSDNLRAQELSIQDWKALRSEIF